MSQRSPITPTVAAMRKPFRRLCESRMPGNRPVVTLAPESQRKTGSVDEANYRGDKAKPQTLVGYAYTAGKKGPPPGAPWRRRQRAQSHKRVQCCFGYSRFELQLDDPTLQAYGYGMGSVVRAKFGENTLDVALDRIQRDLQLICD